MSVKQLEHIFQNGYNGRFDKFSPTFRTDGHIDGTTVSIDIQDTNVPFKTWYIEGDEVCDTFVNQSILNTVPGQTYFSTIVNDTITRSLYAQNGNEFVRQIIMSSLLDEPVELESCSNLDSWIN